jgi:stalled ribosome rescue protein Dom34
MSHHHVAVWLDHKEARIFHVTPAFFDETTIESPKAHVQLHRKSGSDDGHRAAESSTYYHEVALALRDADEILVLGPATAKLELIKHVHHHDAALVPKIVGVETVDHPTDRQVATYARHYFKAVDQARGA